MHSFLIEKIDWDFSRNGTEVSHWRFHDNRRMNTSADVSKFKILLFHVWILLKPVLGGVDGNLHFPVPSMNRLSQIEPATFSILPCWAFFRDSVFIYFIENILLSSSFIYMNLFINNAFWNLQNWKIL
jgi:hypothetical protein